jgi:hypothetical protein
MSKDFIGFRVTPDVKAQLEAEAEKEMRPLSHLIRDRVIRPLEVKEERTKALAQARKAVENDPSNLNVTLDKKGSVVEDSYEDGISDLLAEVDDHRATWIKQETARLKARMPTRRAEAEAEKNWEKLP